VTKGARQPQPNLTMPDLLLHRPPRRPFLYRMLGALALCPLALAADDPRGHGKSVHGEAFDEGPRQSAILLGPEKTGKTDFAVSSRHPQARAFFHQGITQLHSFAFYEAERSFREVLKLDPHCAMGHWGMALANRFNPKRARELLANASAEKAGADAREVLWIDAFNAFFAEKPDETARRKALVKALEKIVLDFPEDLEAKVWLVLQLWENSSHGIPTESVVALDSLLSEVLRKAPMHPGAHHLRIHIWNRQDDKRALGSAALCGQSAPGMAHMWHMPGHTFSRLQRFADTAWHQEAAARTDNAWILQRRLLPDQIHNYAHNSDWLVETLGFTGQATKALEIAQNMIELPRLAPKTAVIGKLRPLDENSSNSMGVKRLTELLLNFELWDEAIRLADTAYLDKQTDSVREAARQRLLAAAHFAKGDQTKARRAQASLEKALTQAFSERVEAADEAERKAAESGKSGADLAKAAHEVLQQRKLGVDSCRSQLAETRLLAALAKKDTDTAELQLKQATQLNGSRKALLLSSLGKHEEAVKLARESAEKEPGCVFPAAVFVETLWKQGKIEEAKRAFDVLRKAAAHAELTLPILKRIEPVARACGLPSDWRTQTAPLRDAGVRPDIESLGPLRWSPQPAPLWSLPENGGQELALEKFKGGPVLLIFYLGSGCRHCIEQLNAFTPSFPQYTKAGIPIVAISTDAASYLSKTSEQASLPTGFPFPIVANPDLSQFKAYGAFDDFENQPLHGIFLLDGDQRIRWQDISFRPFDQPEWLLEEARRLLRFTAHAAGDEVQATATTPR
jgi:peroxiredoxin/tetratricopeptide (TPR) repeat protein